MAIRPGRERPEKILVAMHRLAEGSPKFLKYEDIVVKAFQMFPDEFALRGHPEYPDSSDIHKPLYGTLKKRGFVKAAQKQFALTPRGVERAEALIGKAGQSLDVARRAERMTRDIELELDRMLNSDAYRLFAQEQADRILDTDFFAFFGCTVRTKKNDFIGRLNSASDTVLTARRLSKPDASTAKTLAELLKYLRQRFKKEIEWKVDKHG